MSERYMLNTRDKALLSSATLLLKKVAADEATKPAQLVSIAKLQLGLKLESANSPWCKC